MFLRLADASDASFFRTEELGYVHAMCFVIGFEIRPRHYEVGGRKASAVDEMRWAG